MKNYILTLLLILIFPCLAPAQSDEYLSGAVPQQEGKVVFEKELLAPGLSGSQIYNSLLKWAEKRFIQNNKDNWGKIIHADPQKEEITCLGEEYLVFTDKTFALDRTRIRYVVTLQCSAGKCLMKINSISYNYVNEGQTQRMSAEEWISDNAALNKKKTKLLPVSKRFRIKTIDLVNSLYDEARSALGPDATVSPVLSR